MYNVPLLHLAISEWRVWQEEKVQPFFNLALFPQHDSALTPYPIDMWPCLALPFGELDDVGVPYNRRMVKYPAAYQPTTIAQYALANWNAYLKTGNENHKQAFMVQANWLLAQESRPRDDMGCWPIPFPEPDYNAPSLWLSALTQGEAISVLIKAYRLTGKESFLQVTRRALRAFDLDIRDGGVTTTMGDDDIFFEEVAIYPATHILNGFLFALFGLYDYVALTDDAHIKELIQRSHSTLHSLLDKFDTGYWSHYDLLTGRMATLFYHSLHIQQLRVLAQYAHCDDCAATALRWESYQQSRVAHLRYFIMSRMVRFRRGLRRAIIQRTHKKKEKLDTLLALAGSYIKYTFK